MHAGTDTHRRVRMAALLACLLGAHPEVALALSTVRLRMLAEAVAAWDDVVVKVVRRKWYAHCIMFLPLFCHFVVICVKLAQRFTAVTECSCGATSGHECSLSMP